MRWVAILLVAGSAHATEHSAIDSYYCLVANIYFEARGESFKGKVAVKDVTLARGGAVCETVFAPRQFSWTHKLPRSKIAKALQGVPPENPTELKAWLAAKKAANAPRILPESYKNFHAVSVKPDWSKSGVVIGRHVFLKDVK